MFEGTYLLILIAGFGGGVIRGLVGFTKHQYKFKNVGFNLPYFIGMMFISGVVGLLTAIAFNESGISIKGIGVINPGIAFIICLVPIIRLTSFFSFFNQVFYLRRKFYWF